MLLSPYVVALSLWWLLLAATAFWLVRRSRLIAATDQVLVGHPSAGLSPAAMRYLFLAGFDSDCVIASVLNAAVSNAYQIAWKPSGFTARKRPGLLASPLSDEERATFANAAGGLLDVLHVGRGREKFTIEAEDRLEAHLRQRFGNHLVNRNVWAGSLALIGAIGIVAITRSIDPAGRLQQQLNVTLMSALLMPGIVWAGYHLMRSFQPDDPVEWMLMALFIFGGILLLYAEWVSVHSLLLYLAPFGALQWWFLQHLPRWQRHAHGRIREILAFRAFLLDRTSSAAPLSEAEYYLIPYLIALDIPFAKAQYFESLLSE